MTKIKLDVVGDPIGHSKSPVIHQTVLEELKLDHEYRKVRVEKGQLEQYLAEVRQKEICGFNLTMPHKQDILPYLDYIDNEALVFNSVNTVKVKGGKLLGYNTDGQGCIWAIKEKGCSCKDKNIVILGAGGVVSTVALKMALEEASSITVLNRTPASANALAENVLLRTGKTVKTGELTTQSMAAAAKDCDILINGTPLGMEGIDSDFEDFSFLNSLKKDSLVYDLIYNPEMTNLLKEAHLRGFNTLNGFGMLIYQGLLADEIFLDNRLELALLKEKIENKLKNFKNF
ncbi:MAG: shikimate dehydrogenase [Clostridia bacterium]|nr:shikimate dehydrogenase [Clostridia bacterium]